MEPNTIESSSLDDNGIVTSSTIAVKKNVDPEDVVAPSEDSGLSSFPPSSPGSERSSVKSETVKIEILNDADKESTIGDGISFVNPEIIAEEKREKESRIRRINPEIIAENRRAKEAYMQEVQEKQYKCLMHLLSKSKAMSSFLNEKVNNKINHQTANKAGKSKGVKRAASSPASVKDGPTPNKRGRVAKKVTQAANKKKDVSKDCVEKEEDSKSEPLNEQNINKLSTKSSKAGKKMNLSEEDISQELESMSDEEEKENSKAIANYVKPKYFEGELRDYQKIGLNWLKALYDHGLNGILADEMGLGKTIQVIAFFAYLMEKRVPGPYMIIVPLSTLPNWIAEFERFAPELPVVVFYGNKEKRKKMEKQVSKKFRLAVNFSTHPIVLATYQMPLYDTSFLNKFNWRYIVIDEAQRIKNFNTQLFKILKTYKSVNRLLLTGTPLQNNLSELWSLLNYLLPEIFNDLNVFESWFDAKDVRDEEGQKKFFRREQEKQVMFALREILKPFMLRRLKEEVCPEIPPFKEVMVYTPLTSFQHQLYSAILNRDLDKLYMTTPKAEIVDINGERPKRKCTKVVNLDQYFKDQSTSASPSSSSLKTDMREREITNWEKYTTVTDDNVEFFIRLRFGNDTIMYRHVVNHPYIIHQPLDYCGLAKVDENLIKISGKMLVLDAMLKKLKSKGHKILLFSTMTMVLDIIEDYLYMRDYQYVRLDGTVKYEDRRCNIEKFQTDPEVFIFLLTTKAGAVGLNLAAADTVIIYDSDYNPQNDLQAMARCHRIGQTKPVVVYRLCTKGSVDEEIIRRANAKRFLEKAVISKEGSIAKTYEGLMQLKKLLDENIQIVDSKKEVYTDAELEEMLDRSDMIRNSKVENE